jgi:MscS family membrane protein
MLEKILHQLALLDKTSLVLVVLMAAPILTGLLYLVLFYVFRPIFRKLEGDFLLVTLGVSAYPILIVFNILYIQISFQDLIKVNIFPFIDHVLTASLVITLSYWSVKLFNEVFIYYVKVYTRQSEAMWDDVLLPILSAIVPVIIYIVGGFFFLGSVGIDLTGIWVALGGVTFVLGFALQDILANFFSGIVLLIDTPFRFGDILVMEDGELGILRQIGIRVTKIYIFSNHCDVYIPNSVLQGQKITNLSRPTTFYSQSLTIELPAECDVDQSKQLIEEIVLAHPDTLGDIERKLALISEYFIPNDDSTSILDEQQELGKERILAEQGIYAKLEEIEQSLEALVVAMQFAEKGGLTADEIDNMQLEYQEALELMGFQNVAETVNNRTVYNFEESANDESLVELIRVWYRIWIRDPHLLEEDQYFITDEWERKINFLQKKAQRLYQKIANPESEETRLDDYVQDLIKWIKEKMKVPRKKWQEPQVRMVEMSCSEVVYFSIKFDVTFFVDEIQLEDGKRGERVKSQIYEEIVHHFKQTYLEVAPKIEV